MQCVVKLLLVLIAIASSVGYGEKTIYEKVLLKKKAAAAATRTAKDNPFFHGRYQQSNHHQQPVRIVYVYPDEIMKFPPKKQTMFHTSQAALAHANRGSMPREQYVQQYNKLKSEIATFLPSIMRTVHNIPSSAGDSSRAQDFNHMHMHDYIPSTMPTFNVNPVQKFVSKSISIPMYVIPNSAVSMASKLPTVVPQYSFIRVPTVFKTPSTTFKYIDFTNDRDYYKPPSYIEHLQQQRQQQQRPLFEDIQEALPSEYNLRYLDGDFIMARSDKSKDIEKGEEQSQLDNTEGDLENYLKTVDRQSKDYSSNGEEKVNHDAEDHQVSSSLEKDEPFDAKQNENKEINGDFKTAKKHRKGYKTSGYHSIFHKDEYVKDHIFYDDLDQSGHFNKYEKIQNKSDNQIKSNNNLELQKDIDHEKNFKRTKDLLNKGVHEKKDNGSVGKTSQR